jgi:glycosyltransferase involved in cell wall biosynthesis
MHKVSVIVPNYNHAQFLKQRIDSILAQTFKDYELIVLDDCSTDGSQDIIRFYSNAYPSIRVIANNQNSGSPFKQWDLGVRHASGDYVWIAESDDAATSNFLEEMVPVLEKNNDLGLAYCDAIIINDKGKPTASFSRTHYSSDRRRMNDYINEGKDEIDNYLSINNTINNASGVLFRKASYMDAGMADHGMIFCGDWFLYLRMLLISNIAYKAKPYNLLRIHRNSSSQRYYQNSLYIEEVMQIYKFIMQTLAIPLHAKKKIHDALCLHFCLQVKSGRFPSMEILSRMREIVPSLGLSISRFLLTNLFKKVLQLNLWT